MRAFGFGRVRNIVVLELLAILTVSAATAQSAQPAVTAPAAASVPTKRVELGDFASDLDGWTYYGGWEFKGAGGKLEHDKTVGRQAHGSARLTGDFSKGGSYVAMKRACNAAALSMSFWIKAEGLSHFSVRLTDATGQTFQRKVDLTASGQWQRVELTDLSKADGYFGGAKDGVWHGPLKAIWIMLTVQKNRGGGTLWVDDVEAVCEQQALFLPATTPADIQPPTDSIFGFSGHMIHTDFFYGPERFGPYWGLEYTLPFVVRGGFGWMREALYQGFFTGDDAEKVASRRAKFEQYLDMYDRAGVKVVLCPLFSTVGNKTFPAYFEWLGDLCAKHRCIAAVEMHNEPNLRSFWRASEKDYADSCKLGASILKAKSPNTPVIIGSISHLWWGPGVQWLQRVLRYGTIEVADGFSAHPYRNGAPPEGGSLHAAADDPQGLESELRDWWGMAQTWNPTGKPLKLYLTEVGYSTGKDAKGIGVEVDSLDRQGDYISRLALVLLDVRLRGVPIETVNWYDLKCDYDNSGVQGNFGVISYDTSRVRPAYQAYSRVAKAFGNSLDLEPLNLKPAFSHHADVVKTLTWRRFSDGALIVAFWRLNQLQDKDEDFASQMELKLPDGFAVGAVTLSDLYEDAPRQIGFSVVEGKIAVPVRVSARAVWVVIRPAAPRATQLAGTWHWTLPARFDAGKARMELRGPWRLRLGDPAPLELAIDNTAGTGELSGEIVLMCQPVAFTVPAGKQQTVALPAPALQAAGSEVMHYHVRVGDAMVGRGGFVRLMQDPITLTAPPFVNDKGELRIGLANDASREMTATGVSWISGDKQGQEKLQTRLPPADRTLLTVPALKPKPYAPLPLDLKVDFRDRPGIAWSGDAGCNPCWKLTPTIDGDLDEWKTLPAIDLIADGKVMMTDHAGPKDLSGTIWIGYDESNFYLALRVTDNQFHQPYNNADTWRADGLQFSLAAGTMQADDWHELGLALTPKGSLLWRWTGPEGTKPGKMEGRHVVRNEGDTTIYECAIPWSQLAPLSPKDDLLRFSLLVNDSDGKTRKGWIEWGSGIGRDKKASLFRLCQLAR